MTIVPGKVVNGRVEVDLEDFELPEGAEVSVFLPADDENEEMSPQEQAELDAELDAAIAEADRGEGIPADEILRELRAMAEEEIRRRRA